MIYDIKFNIFKISQYENIHQVTIIVFIIKMIFVTLH